jgi:hypothetical protein
MPLTSSDLLSPLTTKGSMDDYNARLNKAFSEFTATIAANSVATRAGSAGSFSYPIPADVAALPLPASSTTDPWGNPIIYSQPVVLNNVTSGTNASLTAFVLTSLGPDVALGTADDIVKAVSVAQLKSEFIKSGW